MSHSAYIAQTEQRIAEVNALQQSITDLQNELHVFHEELRKQIAALRQEGSPVPAEPPPRQQSSRAVPARPQPDSEPVPPPAPTRQVKVQPVVASLPRRAIDDEVDEMAAAEGGEEPQAQEEVTVGGRPVSVMISNGMADSEPQPGWVIDRPPNGLRILFDEPVQAGTVLSLRATKEHPQNQWITVSVRNCRPERNSYLVNVHFIERPPWAVMNLLNGS